MNTYFTITISLLCSTIVLVSCATQDAVKTNAPSSSSQRLKYDEARFEEIEAILDSKRDKLRGIPFEEFLAILGIENAPWDKNYTNQSFHSRRTYHLGGFCLDIGIEHKKDQLFTHSHFYPGLHADGLNREKRVIAQQEGLDEYFSERAAGHKRTLDESRRRKEKDIQQENALDTK